MTNTPSPPRPSAGGRYVLDPDDGSLTRTAEPATAAPPPASAPNRKTTRPRAAEQEE